MVKTREHKLSLVAAEAHGMLSVLAICGEECHREQAAKIANRIAELLWPDDPHYMVTPR